MNIFKFEICANNIVPVDFSYDRLKSSKIKIILLLNVLFRVLQKCLWGNPGKSSWISTLLFLVLRKFTVSGRKGRPQRSLSMKKTVLCIVLAAAMLLAACTGSPSGGNSADSTSTVSTTPTPIPSDFNFSPDAKLTDCMPGQWKALKDAYDAGTIDHVEYLRRKRPAHRGSPLTIRRFSTTSSPVCRRLSSWMKRMKSPPMRITR